MNAVVLVGGGGTRLRPLTYAVPKPLVPVINRPLIAHILENLARHGVEHVVLAAAAGERRIEETLGSGAGLGLELAYSYETEPLGSGLAVKQAARDFDSAFFVCNGDVITDLDLSAMAARHRERAAVLSIFLAAVDDPSAFGVAQLGESDRIVRFVEKPPPGEAPGNWANAGTWIFEPAVLDHIPDERMDRSLEQLVFPALIGDGLLVQGFPSDAYWMDVGTSERYLRLHADILEGRLPGWLPEKKDTGPYVRKGTEIDRTAVVDAQVIVGPGCRLSRLVHVTGPSVLGSGCRLEDEAVVERSILWNDVTVGPKARVSDSILGEGCRIGAGAIVESAVLANGSRVEAGVHLPPSARLEPGEVAN